MKKIKLSILSILAMFIASSIFYSCSNADNEIIAETNSISPSEIGKFHNEVLKSLIFDENNLGKIEQLLINDLLEERISETLNKIDANLFNAAKLNQVKQDYNTIFLEQQKYSMKSINSKNTDVFIEFLDTNGKISSNLSEHFFLIFDDVKINDEKAVLKKIDNLRNINFGGEDQKYVDVFISTFDASYSFWNDDFRQWQSEQTSNKKYAAKFGWGDIGVIWADAAGAAAGLAVSGGFGSIFLAAYASTAAGAVIFQL